MTIQKRATVISSSVAALLAIMKLVIGVISGSVAVLASAIDSLLDLAASLFNYFAIHNAEKPADKIFNYGRGKIEALASMLEGTIITLSGFYILYESIGKFFSDATITAIDQSIGVMIVSFVVTGVLVLYLNRVAHATNNLVIKSDALHYKTDVYSNAIILVSLVVIHFTGFGLIDAILGALIALYIIYSAYALIKEGVMMLMDRALEEETVQQIITIIQSEERVSGYHFLKTRQAGRHKFVDVHLVFDPSMSLVHAHQASDNIEFKISELDDDAEWIFNIHLDPVDDSGGEDEFGHDHPPQH